MVYDLVCDPLVANIGEPSRLVKFAVRSSQLPLPRQVTVKVTLSPTAKPTTVLLPKSPAEALNPPLLTALQPGDASASRLVPQINTASASSSEKKIMAERIEGAPRVRHRWNPISPHPTAAAILGGHTAGAKCQMNQVQILAKRLPDTPIARQVEQRLLRPVPTIWVLSSASGHGLSGEALGGAHRRARRQKRESRIAPSAST